MTMMHTMEAVVVALAVAVAWLFLATCFFGNGKDGDQ